MQPFPSKIDRYSDTEMLLAWNTGEQLVLAYTELRFACPCAGCVDERTGERTLRREDVATDVRPVGVQLVGRYAVQISWSDRHDTGMYSFDRLYHIATKHGRPKA